MSNVFRSLKDLINGRQHNRILRLSFPNNDGPDCEFVVNKLDAFEGLSRDFEFTIEILANDSTLALKDIQGKLMSVELVQQGGTLRYFSGYCFSFRLKRAGNVSFYEAKLSPWLKYLSLRNDCYIFHEKTLNEQATEIFGDYASIAKWEFRYCADQVPMTDAVQFNETDYNYLNRRWEAAGLHHFYEHSAKGHVLIISSNSTRAEPIDGNSEILFHRHAGSSEENSISDWSPVRQITPGRVRVGSFDFKNPQPDNMSAPSLNEQGDILDIESYEYAGAYGFKEIDDGLRLAGLRISEMDARGKLYEAVGNNSYVQPGRWCSLVDRFGRYPFGDNRDINANKFLIVEVHHTATNNYLQQADEAPHYSNRLTCIRKSVRWRPGRSFNSIDTKIFGIQTAIVVGPKGQGSIHTDQYGRIRVQFMWDREGKLNEVSSGWIRVSSSWAGAQLGAAAIPRVNSEVLVQWLGGDPDRAVVTGCVHNALYTRSWALPSQQALTGFRSRELTLDSGNTGFGRSNHLILDDSDKEIQVQLKSDHQHSQLSLGHITRIEDNAGRLDARGEGWELRTDAWGVARAAKGMLLTTEARNNAASHIKDMGETVGRLTAARDLHEVQADMARQHGAQEKTGQQGAVADAIKAQNDAIKGAGGGANAGAFPELSAPHLVLASPAGIEMTTAHSTHIASDQHTAITTGKSLSIASGDSLFASIRQTFRLFVHKAGMKMIAAAGDIDMQALTDSINILAKLNITQTANRITITAKEEVVINGGGSYTRYNAGGIEHGTNGSWVAHAANHSLPGPQNMETVRQADFEKSVPKKYSQRLVVDAALWNLPSGIKAVQYKFISEAHGVLGTGKIDTEGKSPPLFTESGEPTSIEIDVNNGLWEDIYTERHDAISLPDEAEIAVFDYPEHSDVSIDQSDDPDNPDNPDAIDDKTEEV